MNPLVVAASLAAAVLAGVPKVEKSPPRPSHPSFSLGLGRPAGPRGHAFSPGEIDYAERGPIAPKSATQPNPPEADGDLGRIAVVYLGGAQVIRLNVALTHAGRSVSAAWYDYLRVLFAYFDRDRDGVLNAYETEQCYSAVGMRALFYGNYYTPASGPAPDFRAMDTDGDRKISPAEFVAYFAEMSDSLFRERRAQTTADDGTTENLIVRLDADKDGKLSKAELTAAPKLLFALDTDEDETVSLSEVFAALPRRKSSAAGAEMMNSNMMGMKGNAAATAVLPAAGDLFLYPGRALRGEVVPALIAKYDRNKNGKLEADESPFDGAATKRLDRDGNAVLDDSELHAWTRETAGVELLVDVGVTPESGGVTVVGDLPAGAVLRRESKRRAVLRFGSQSVELSLFVPDAKQSKSVYDGLIASVFGAKKHIDEQDLGGISNQFIRSIFDSADVNADGRLIRAELVNYFDMQRRTMDLGFALSASVNRPTLFQVLDDDHDGKLSLRELRTAWERLSLLEAPGATTVSAGILRPVVFLQASPGPAFNGARLPLSDDFTQQTAMQPAAPKPGPIWFSRMDRNSDGDVSRGEFLGSAAQFAVIDTDKDDLISLAEGEAHDRKLRPKPPQR